MKSRLRLLTRPLLLILTVLLILPGGALAAGAGDRIYDNTRQVSDTLTYGNIASSNSSGRQESYSLTYTPGGDIQAIVSAGASVYGASNINSVISHAESRGYNVVGGINADFFSMQTGVMEGLYISEGRLYSGHDSTNVVAFREDGSAFVSSPRVSFTLYNEGGGSGGNAGKTVSVPFYNKWRQQGYINLLDSNYSANTRTTTSGREVIFRVLSGEVRVNSSVQLEVVDVLNSAGAIPIEEGHIVLTADTRCPSLGELDKFSVGDRVTLRVDCSDARLDEAMWATAGGDILVSDGVKTNSSSWDSSIAGINPRSALGIKADGSVMLYAVDGRQSSHSVGLTLNELADEMLALGCTTVLNLDGGGSTSFSYRYPGTNVTATMNTPSDGSLRACANYILLVSKNGGGGEAAYVHYSPLETTVLAGSRVTPDDLSTARTATDSGYYPAAVPGGPYTYEDSGLGYAEDGYFRTARTDATGKLTAYAANGAKGWLGLRLVTTPDSITVRAGGGELNTLTVIAGDQVALGASATYGGSAIVSSTDAYSFSVTEGMGWVDAEGRFTATGEPGSGQIAVSAGDRTRVVELIIAAYFADTAGHWAETAIGQLKESGLVTGYSTDLGTYFYPDQDMTRAEFSTLLGRMLGIDPDAYSLSATDFTDRDSIPDWAGGYAAAMYEMGYITGKGATGGVIFDPDAPITRGEMFTLLGRMLEGTAPESVLDRFTDRADIPDWAAAEIAKLVQAGMLTGYDDGTLLPNRNSSRAECLTILTRLDLDALLTGTALPAGDGADTREPEFSDGGPLGIAA